MIEAFHKLHTWFYANSITNRPKITINCNGDSELKERIGHALRKEYDRNMITASSDPAIFSGIIYGIAFEVID